MAVSDAFEFDGRRPITSSELKNYLTDRRKWWLADVRGLRLRRAKSNPTGTIVVGDRYHQGLEAYYRALVAGESVEDAKGAAFAGLFERAGREQEEYALFSEDIAKEVELVRIMLEGYFEWQEDEAADADLEVIAAEQMLVVPLRDPEDKFVLLGKLDGRAKNVLSGHSAFLEHKAVANFSDMTKWMHVNPQFLHYDLLEFLFLMEQGMSGDEAEANRTDGLLLNMARTVKRTGRATPPFYAREPVMHNREELRSYWMRVVALAQEMELARERLAKGEDPRIVCPGNPTKDSTWADPYFAAYAMHDDGSDVEGYLSEFFEERDPLERYAEEAAMLQSADKEGAA